MKQQTGAILTRKYAPYHSVQERPTQSRQQRSRNVCLEGWAVVEKGQMLRYRDRKDAVGGGQNLWPHRLAYTLGLTLTELGISSRIQTVGSRRDGSFANQRRVPLKGRNGFGEGGWSSTLFTKRWGWLPRHNGEHVVRADWILHSPACLAYFLLLW